MGFVNPYLFKYGHPASWEVRGWPEYTDAALSVRISLVLLQESNPLPQ